MNSKIIKLIDWRVFFLLLVLCMAVSAGVMPYVVSMGGFDERIGTFSVKTLILMQIAQAFMFFSMAIFFGLLLAKKTGFEMPGIDAVFKKENVPRGFWKGINTAIVSGSLTGLIIFFADKYIFNPNFMQGALTIPPAWQRLLACFYGGVAEEVAMRLFFMSLLVWLTCFFKSKPGGKPVSAGVWAGILGVSVIFALAHLPITYKFMEITPIIIARALLLNGLGSIVFGWFYWKNGLEAACVSHFSADFFIHVVLS